MSKQGLRHPLKSQLSSWFLKPTPPPLSVKIRLKTYFIFSIPYIFRALFYKHNHETIFSVPWVVCKQQLPTLDNESKTPIPRVGLSNRIWHGKTDYWDKQAGKINVYSCTAVVCKPSICCLLKTHTDYLDLYFISENQSVSSLLGDYPLARGGGYRMICNVP